MVAPIIPLYKPYKWFYRPIHVVLLGPANQPLEEVNKHVIAQVNRAQSCVWTKAESVRLTFILSPAYYVPFAIEYVRLSFGWLRGCCNECVYAGQMNVLLCNTISLSNNNITTALLIVWHGLKSLSVCWSVPLLWWFRAD